MLYTYEATDKEGAVEEGEFEASSKKAVVEHLRGKGLIPTKIEKIFARGPSRGRGLAFVMFERITPLDRILLVRNLAATVKAGLSISEALDILIADATKNTMRNILTQAKSNLQAGQPLSKTFESFKKIFSVVFVGMIKAGEASGKLGESLEELSHHLTREYNLTRKVRSALAYPLLLLSASFGIIVLLMVFVLPRLAKTFEQSGVELPFFTKVLFVIGGFIGAHPILDVLFLAGIIWFLAYFRTTPLGRRTFLKIFLMIPIARVLVKKIALVRFTRTLGSLISSGTPIVDSLRLSAESVGNEDYKKAILESAEKIKTGVPLSKILEGHPKLFPRFLTSLTVVGERTGTLEHILKTFSNFYDEEVDNTLKDLSTFIEPLLLLVMGLIIGTIAFSIVLPIYQIIGQFS